MTELTVPFWLAGGWVADRAQLPDWLKSRHIQPRWIDEEILLSAQTGPTTPLIAPALFFQWPRALAAESQVLQQAAREIAVGERRMVLLSVLHPEGCRLAVLCSPAAVGMYNLMPLAYVTDWLTLPSSAQDSPVLSLLETVWARRERKVAQVKELSLLLPGKRPVKGETAFKNAAWVSPEQSVEGGIGAAQALVEALIAKKQGNALLVEYDERQQLFSCWIEAV